MGRKEQRTSRANIGSAVHATVARFFSWSLVKTIVAIDLFLLLCTLARCEFREAIDSKTLKWIIVKFDLSIEMNFAVWWSAVLLFMVGLHALQNSISSQSRISCAWRGISVIFFIFSLDEIGSIHERIGSWILRAPVALVCLVILSYSLVHLYRNKRYQYSAKFITAGIALFGLTVFLEFLESELTWSFRAAGLRTVLEEGIELVGMLLALLGVISVQTPDSRKSLRDFLPNYHTVEGIRYLVIIALVGHIVSAVTVLSWSKITKWGHPVVWLPIVLYFVLFGFVVRRALCQLETRFLPPLWYSLCQLTFSLIIPFVFTKSLELSSSHVREEFGPQMLLSFWMLYYIIQILVLWIAAKESSNYGRSSLILIFSIGILNLLAITRMDSIELVLVTIGVNAFLHYEMAMQIYGRGSLAARGEAVRRAGKNREEGIHR